MNDCNNKKGALYSEGKRSLQVYAGNSCGHKQRSLGLAYESLVSSELFLFRAALYLQSWSLNLPAFLTLYMNLEESRCLVEANMLLT